MNRVRQEDPLGCLIACVAMIVGQTYSEVRASAYPDYDPAECADRATAIAWLHERGFEVVALRKHFRAKGDAPIATEPFAKVHLCCVLGGLEVAHAVIMLEDGTVLDPAFPYPRRLTDYQDTIQICAVNDLHDIHEPADS